MSLAPPLAVEHLAALRRYRVPSDWDVECMVRSSKERLRQDRQLSRLGLGLCVVGALACALILPVVDGANSVGLLSSVLITLLVFAAFLLEPSRRTGLGETARQWVQARFAPLTPSEASTVLAFLQRYPEAAAIIATWLRDIPYLRAHEYEQFKGLFHAGLANTSPQEVTDTLTLIREAHNRDCAPHAPVAG